MIRLTREPIDYHALAESVREPHCGATSLFLGTVRDLTGEFVTVYLDYEAWCGETGEEPLGKQTFNRHLAERFRKRRAGGGAWTFFGCALRYPRPSHSGNGDGNGEVGQAGHPASGDPGMLTSLTESWARQQLT